ncbi:uncharacterized protein LOC143587915 [Bidens hawaiensis]|uniref:uncharacterized protein LOC143587915 n=1 Tax=Bidens hawaiensis TaxID=980011 RepID=UPI00404B0ECA
MNRRNHIPPLLPTPPPQFMIRNQNTTITTTVAVAAAALHRHQTHLLFTENQRLTAVNASLSQSLADAKQEVCYLRAVAGKVKAEREAAVREVEDRAEKIAAEVKVVGEWNDELAKTLGEVRRLVAENKELEEKLKKVKDDVAEVEASDEWKQLPVVKQEIEMMKKEIERGRAVIEHERRVYDCSVNQGQVMANYKILMAAEIVKHQVELSDAGKRARAAAALEAAEVRDPRKRARAAASLEAALIPCNVLLYIYFIPLFLVFDSSQ